LVNQFKGDFAAMNKRISDDLVQLRITDEAQSTHFYEALVNSEKDLRSSLNKIDNELRGAFIRLQNEAISRIDKTESGLTRAL